MREGKQVTQVVKAKVRLQIVALIEKMSELTIELCHELQGHGDFGEIIEEIANVDIMLSQMKILFPHYEQVRAEKLYQFERRDVLGENRLAAFKKFKESYCKDFPEKDLTN